MKLSEYRETHSWQGAIEIGPKLMQLAEELPGAEELGLSLQLRQLMVELPAAVAADLLSDGDTRTAIVLKLTTALELIDHVYPALDTAATRTAADKLAERLITGNFKERVGGPHEPAPAAPAHPVAAIPEPSSVPVIADSTPGAAPAAEGEDATNPHLKVPVAATPAAPQENDVHPDSVQ